MKRFCLVLVVISVLAVNAWPQEDFDIVIRGGRLVDGSGNPWIRADVGIRDDRIVRIGDLRQAAAERFIDADRLVVAPGFIDPHTHAVRGIFDVPTADSALLQGVTTLIEGNDGSSPYPIADHLERIQTSGISTNWALFVGQGTVRSQVIGAEDRAATPGEMAQMKRLVADAMEQGALGISTGLFYVPGSFTSTEEVIALSKEAARYKGMYISHMRDEVSGLLDSVRETIRIGEEAGLPVQMTHHKVVGKDMFTSARGMEPTPDNAAVVVMDLISGGGARAVYHAMSEEDVERIMQHPATAIGSDGPLSVFGEGTPHPRQYGTFARVLGYYVRERGILRLEEAVRKMTSATAQRLGIRDRGLLREGYLADVTIFDADKIRDTATFAEPHQYAVGVRFVIVNGQVVVAGGEHTGLRPGRVIHGPGFSGN